MIELPENADFELAFAIMYYNQKQRELNLAREQLKKLLEDRLLSPQLPLVSF